MNVNVNLESQPRVQTKMRLITFTFTGKILSSGTQLYCLYWGSGDPCFCSTSMFATNMHGFDFALWPKILQYFNISVRI